MCMEGYGKVQYSQALPVFPICAMQLHRSTSFIQRALDAGVRFTPEQVLEMAINIEKPILSRAAELSSIPFQTEDLEEIYMLIDDKSFERISARSKIDIFADEEAEDPEAFDDEETILPPARSPGLLTTLLAAFTFSGSGRKRDSGRCDGDCAHCPPHYGYRYGRWYYGHGHDWGCELCGNGGCSGKCTRD